MILLDGSTLTIEQLLGIDKFFFATSGTEANEAAIKMARMVTGKHKIIARYTSYHGSTIRGFRREKPFLHVIGLRPVLEIMFGDFLPLAMDSILNQATKFHFLDGEGGVPMVVRCVVGAGGRFGAIHSQTPIPWLHGVTGIKLVAPSTPADAKGLLRAAIQDENPVLFFEHKRLYPVKGPPGDDEPLPLGQAAVVREGDDLTIASAMKGVHDALEAAERLSTQGVEAEVIDLRTIRPLDFATVLGSVAKTNRLAVVEEGPLTGGWAGEVLARVTEEALGDLDDAWRIATAESLIPYSPPLEDAFLPGAERIASEIRARLG